MSFQDYCGTDVYTFMCELVENGYVTNLYWEDGLFVLEVWLRERPWEIAHFETTMLGNVVFAAWSWMIQRRASVDAIRLMSSTPVEEG